MLIFAAASIALLAGIGARSFIDTSKAEASQAALPEFSLPDMNGKEHSINEWKDKVIVLNFWATWCQPCLTEMPEFNQLHKDYSGKGLQVIGIALDEQESVKEFVDKYKISYPVLVSPDQGIKIAHDLGNVVNTVPFTIIANKKGNIVARHMGTLTGKELLRITGPLLNRL